MAAPSEESHKPPQKVPPQRQAAQRSPAASAGQPSPVYPPLADDGQPIPMGVPVEPGADGDPQHAPVAPLPQGQALPPSSVATPSDIPTVAPAAARTPLVTDFGQQTTSVAGRRKTHRKSVSPLILGGGLAAVMIVAGLGYAFFVGGTQPLVLKPIDDRVVDELAPLEFVVGLVGDDDPSRQLQFTLLDAPEGATLDAKTGQFSWTPTEAQGPGWYEMVVRVGTPNNTASDDAANYVQQKFGVQVQEVRQPLVFTPIESKTAQVGVPLSFCFEVTDPDLPVKPVRFRLARGVPPGARVDPHSGQFEWTPDEHDAGRSLKIVVQAAKTATGAERVEQEFEIRVEGGDAMPAPQEPLTVARLIGDWRKRGVKVVASEKPFDCPKLSGEVSVWEIGPERFALYEYTAPAAASEETAAIKADDLNEYVALLASPAAAHVFCAGRVSVFYVGQHPQMLNLLAEAFDRPVVVARAGASESVAEQPKDTVPSEPSNEPPNQFDQQDKEDQEILALYDAGQLLNKSEYPKLRKIYADRFARNQAEQIQTALGDEKSEIRQWLDENVDIKEELFLAIDPEHDDVVGSLRLFRELKEKYPEAFPAYANLATAVAVVWDRPQGVLQGSPIGQHQSVLPEGQMSAMENFKYFVDAKKYMMGRAQFLPWEFLVHLVNHGTTLEERKWALVNYVPKRVGYGKCYHDVPYDNGMLSGEPSLIQGKPHTLQNARQFGGVCSCQADFAARVGKSIGVPAFYASAPNKYGSRHAWVMWVELGTVTPTGFTFSLESYGRYRGDKYYVGALNDPHTGQPTTDRETELRLQTVGMDPIAKRHAQLVMRSYPMLQERGNMDVTARLVFLNKVIEYSPGNEAAWIALAQMSREGLITKTNSKPMVVALDRLFKTFARVPDFTWVVFDDMIAFQDIPKKRAALYQRLLAMYEQAGRVDLSCEARMKYAEQLVAQKEHKQAIEVLAAGVLSFPDEGRFVPVLIGKIEELLPEVKGGGQLLAQLYQQILPRIPPKRGNEASKYCIEMYEKGIEQFRAAGLLPLAQFYEAELLKLRVAK